MTGLVASWLLDFSLLEGLLLGSILAATDGAAIFALLRGSSLRRRLAHTLEAESGFNDPVAILLVLGFIEWIQSPGYGIADMAWLFARELGIGLVVGLAVGAGAVWTFRRLNLETAGLYPVASIATAGLAYGGAASIDGSGFLAVYLAGLALGGAHIPAKRTVTAFHEGLAWVAQITLFLTLGLLVFPSQLGDVLVEGTLIGLVVAFVARPLATALATAFGRYDARERLVLGWAGLRGAVPVVLATFPVIDGVSDSIEVFNIVFFAVVISTILQGTTFESLGRALGATSAQPALPRPLTETGTIRGLGAEVVEFVVGEGDAIAGRRVRELGLPREALVSVIVRGNAAVLPRGSTRIEAGDRLHLVVRKEVSRDFPKADRALAQRAHRAGGAAEDGLPGPPADLQRSSLASDRWRPGPPRCRGREGGRRAPARPPRSAGLGCGPGGRPLCGHRLAADRRQRDAGATAGAQMSSAGRGRDAARLVARGDRRPGADEPLVRSAGSRDESGSRSRPRARAG